MKKFKLGFIGYRNFAAKLLRCFKDSGAVSSIIFYHPKRRCIEAGPCTQNLRDLFECDCIVIASPDWSHSDYLRRLKDYKGYIFCEKIPVTSQVDFNYLKNHNNKKLYFNFKYRKSILQALLEGLSSKILYINCQLGHGLAFKNEYRDNWRSDPSLTPLGVFQVSGIHFFDLLLYSFGRPRSYHFTGRRVSPFSKSIDNATVSLEFKNKISAQLFFSYSSPYLFCFDIVTSDQIIRISDSYLEIRGPRETFDKNGHFREPKIIRKDKLCLNEDSLKESVRYFLDIVRSGRTFPEARHPYNLLSTELFLEMDRKFS